MILNPNLPEAASVIEYLKASGLLCTDVSDRDGILIPLLNQEGRSADLRFRQIGNRVVLPYDAVLVEDRYHSITWFWCFLANLPDGLAKKFLNHFTQIAKN